MSSLDPSEIVLAEDRARCYRFLANIGEPDFRPSHCSANLFRNSFPFPASYIDRLTKEMDQLTPLQREGALNQMTSILGVYLRLLTVLELICCAHKLELASFS